MAKKWTDEDIKQAVELYQKQDPTPENTMQCVQNVAEEMEQNPNGVRAILSKQGVYIKKEDSSTNSKNANPSTGSKRVNKQEAQQELTSALRDAGQEPDEDIVSRLTGKAAKYFTNVLREITLGE